MERYKFFISIVNIFFKYVHISHASSVMLKILQGRLQQNMNQELAYVQGGFRKGRGTRDQIAGIS